MTLGVTATPEAVSNVPSAQPAHELTVLATVAHELRGPLTALATSSELLAEDFLHLDPQQGKSMLGAMASSRICSARPPSVKVACSCTASRSA